MSSKFLKRALPAILAVTIGLSSSPANAVTVTHPHQPPSTKQIKIVNYLLFERFVFSRTETLLAAQKSMQTGAGAATTVLCVALADLNVIAGAACGATIGWIVADSLSEIRQAQKDGSCYYISIDSFTGFVPIDWGTQKCLEK